MQFTYAQDQITLPLKGYYHPGKYIPVHVTAAPQSRAETTLKLSADGALWTFIKLEGSRVDAIFPWLPIDPRATAVHWNLAPRIPWHALDPPLKPLTDHQRLVGFAGVDSTAALTIAQKIFPADELIPIPLNTAQPLAGAAASWESLDLAVLDPAAASRVGEAQFGDLVALGVAFAFPPSNSQLWPHWPWQRTPEGWSILRYLPAGPSAASYENAPVIYEPVSSWRSGWPLEIRRMFLLLAAAFAIPLLLLALWRPRFVAIYALVLSAAGLTAFYWVWAKYQRPTATLGAKVRIISPGITQDDDWAYQTSHLAIPSMVRWVNTTKPMFASRAQLDYANARIVCHANGDPDFLFFNLAPNDKVALLARRCGPQAPVVNPSPQITTPIASMVKSLYLTPGDRIIGELPSAPLIGESYVSSQIWPGLVIQRAANSPPDSPPRTPPHRPTSAPQTAPAAAP